MRLSSTATGNLSASASARPRVCRRTGGSCIISGKTGLSSTTSLRPSRRKPGPCPSDGGTGRNERRCIRSGRARRRRTGRSEESIRHKERRKRKDLTGSWLVAERGGSRRDLQDGRIAEDDRVHPACPAIALATADDPVYSLRKTTADRGVKPLLMGKSAPASRISPYIP